MRQLKVYKGNLDGVNDVIMACHSMREFMAATRITRNWFTETGNVDDIAVAMAQPGTTFIRSMKLRNDIWKPVKL
jgi:hypothetical protein